MSNFIVRPGVDIPAMLKSKGYSSYRIAREKTFCSGAMQKFRDGKLPSWGELAKLVHLLNVSPVDLIAFQADDGTITTFDSIPATPIVPPQETIQAAPETTPVPAPVAAPDGPQPTQAPQLQPVPPTAPVPDSSPDMECISVLSPVDQRVSARIDGAVKYGYGVSRDRYILDAILSQLRQDEATERRKRAQAEQARLDAYYANMPDNWDDPDDDY